MIVKDLVKLADSLDASGNRDLANAVDNILRRYAEDLAEEKLDEGAEEPAEAPAKESSPEAVAPAAPTGEDQDAKYAEVPGGQEMSGMLGDSWYGEGPQWDLSPISDGSMLDKRQPLPTDAGAASAPVAAPEGEVAEEVPAEEPAAEEVSSEDESDKEEMTQEAALKLAELADQLDKKGYRKEADMIDEILSLRKKS